MELLIIYIAAVFTLFIGILYITVHFIEKTFKMVPNFDLKSGIILLMTSACLWGIFIYLLNH